MQQDNRAATLHGLDPGATSVGYAHGTDIAEIGLQPCRGRFEGENAVAACDGVIDLLAIFFNVSSRQLRSAKRASLSISRVRQIGMYIAHVTLGMKMTAVGAGFGRDKSTVVHACHTIEDLRDDEDFDLIVARVERLVVVAFSLDRRTEGRDD
jgi:hypothetical protein